MQIEETVEILEQGENDDVNERSQKRTITINNSTTQSEVQGMMDALDKKGLTRQKRDMPEHVV